VSLLDRLPAQYRDVLYLRYNLGYDVKEIAPLLGISKDNAKKRITRAKTQLARLIEEWDGDE
jgi:RNA polymerase sigma-70 factor (ECF subfamily)